MKVRPLVENLSNTQPCSLCGSVMVCYNTADISHETANRSHYLLACSQCGFGPAIAFPTLDEAITHWNILAANQPLEQGM